MGGRSREFEGLNPPGVPGNQEDEEELPEEPIEGPIRPPGYEFDPFGENGISPT